MAATAIHGTTQPTYTKRIVGSDIPPCEDSASEHLSNQEDKHIRPLWLTTYHMAQVHKFDCEVDIGAGCNIILLYIYRSIFGDQTPELPIRMITTYGDSMVTTAGLCKAVLLTWCQVPRKAMFQVMDTSGYLIIGRETARKLGYIHIPNITQPKLIQWPKVHVHLKAISMKTPRQETPNHKDQGLRC